jgi:prolyl 4-hydroxylase
MSTQIVTLELRRWIAEQTRSGQPDEAIVASMVASGWRRNVAATALAEARRQAQPAAPPRSAMPEPALTETAHALRAGGREVQVLATLARPRVVVFGALLDAQECDDLIELAQGRLVRSETVTPATGGSEINAARTSEGMFFGRGENALIARIESRIAELLRWPVDRGEGMQVLRYRPGAEYKPHYDYFDLEQPGTPAILRRGGQRLASVVMYLNTPARGGATTFPDAGLEVAPVRGNAVFFSYERPDPDTLSLHGGAPVVEGEKWVATKWLREGRFD